MSSTLCIRKTPKPDKNEWHFGLPVKAAVGRRFYDHDGSCGGDMITVGAEQLPWFEGIRALSNLEKSEARKLDKIIEVLQDGETIDMWFEF